MQWKSLFIFLLLVNTLLPRSAYAQTSEIATESAILEPLAEPNMGINITLSPVTIQLSTKPGVGVHSEIKIRNNSTVEEELKLTVVPFEADQSGSRPVLRDRRESDIYLSWVKLDQPQVRVRPGEWKTIPFTFAPPADAALSYFFAIQVERANTSPTAGGETKFTGAPAILVLATVESPFAKRELKLNSFKAKHILLEFLPETLEIEIENTGNVHTVPVGDIFIDGQRRKDLAVVSLNPNRLSVLPQTKRTFQVTWEDGFPIFEESAKEGRRLSWDFSKADRLRFGKYTAHIIMVYDNGQRDVPVESTVSFWVIPIRLILVLIVVPALPALLVFVLMRIMMRRQKKTAPVITEP